MKHEKISPGMRKKAQSFSTDIIVVVVIILFGALFIVLNQINAFNQDSSFSEKYDEASDQAQLVFDNLKKQEIIDSENKVNVERLLVLDEEQLREDLGITNEFAIVFEKDGKLVKIDPSANVSCIGSSEIVVNGNPCT